MSSVPPRPVKREQPAKKKATIPATAMFKLSVRGEHREFQLTEILHPIYDVCEIVSDLTGYKPAYVLRHLNRKDVGEREEFTSSQTWSNSYPRIVAQRMA